MASPGGQEKRRRAAHIRHIHLGIVGQQQAHNGAVTIEAGVMQRGVAVDILAVDIGAATEAKGRTTIKSRIFLYKYSENSHNRTRDVATVSYEASRIYIYLIIAVNSIIKRRDIYTTPIACVFYFALKTKLDICECYILLRIINTVYISYFHILYFAVPIICTYAS